MTLTLMATSVPEAGHSKQIWCPRVQEANFTRVTFVKDCILIRELFITTKLPNDELSSKNANEHSIVLLCKL